MKKIVLSYDKTIIINEKRITIRKHETYPNEQAAYIRINELTKRNDIQYTEFRTSVIYKIIPSL